MTDNNGWPGKPGVPLNPERDGWHWRRSCNVGRQPVARYWCAPEKVWQDGPTTYVTIGIASQDYYLGPALTPAEVDARIKEARREALEEAAQFVETHTYVTTNSALKHKLVPYARAKRGLHHATIAAAIRALGKEGND